MCLSAALLPALSQREASGLANPGTTMNKEEGKQLGASSHPHSVATGVVGRGRGREEAQCSVPVSHAGATASPGRFLFAGCKPDLPMALWTF